MNSCIIRSEKPQDFYAVSIVHAATFTHSFGMGEVSIVSVIRNRKEFDPDLSLVAEINGEIVGHVLFTPLQVMVRGELLKAVILAPIAVLAEFQNKGIGSLLIDEGHRRAKERGVDFSFLLGHPEYYSRFGYQTEMWSSSKIKIRVDDIPDNTLLEERRIESSDIRTLCEMWNQWFMEAALAIVPGNALTDWISYGKEIQASAILIDGELSGYLRYEKNDPSKIQSILAKDRETFIKLCGHLKSKLDQVEELSLPLPYNAHLLKQSGLTFKSNIQAGAVRMLKIINEDCTYISDYCNDVSSGKIPPGQLVLPVEFEV